jgi:hypothetical protein
MTHKTKSQFIMHARALRDSPAWRAISGDAHKFLDLIELEHMRHGGQKNGSLIVTYADMAKYGLGHRRICARVIREIAVLGLAEVAHGRSGNREFREPNRYRLTYLPANGKPPTNEWREIKTIEDAKAKLESIRRQRKPSAWLRAKTSKVVPFPA